MPACRFFLATEPPSKANFWGETTRTAFARKCISMFSLLSLHTTWQLRHLAAHFRAPDSPCLGYYVTLALRPAKQSQAGAAAIDEEGGLVHAVARSFVHKRRAKDGWPDEWVVAHAHDRSP